jgi:hypothetical protein
MLPGDLVIENKVAGITLDPLSTGPQYSWQTRRYARAVSTNVLFVVVAYQPPNEAALLDLPASICVRAVGDGLVGHAQVRVVVPYGYPVPSRAESP